MLLATCHNYQILHDQCLPVSVSTASSIPNSDTGSESLKRDHSVKTDSRPKSLVAYKDIVNIKLMIIKVPLADIWCSYCRTVGHTRCIQRFCLRNSRWTLPTRIGETWCIVAKPFLKIIALFMWKFNVHIVETHVKDLWQFRFFFLLQCIVISEFGSLILSI